MKKTDDYYEILGVGRDATQDEIKTRYRKLAKQYHPDKNPGNKAAEDTFKKISEAYAVLSDPEKKKKFDMFGSEKFHQQYSREDIFSGTNINDLLRDMGFGDMFGGGGQARYGGAATQNLDITSKITISLEDAVRGAEKRLSLQTGEGTESLTVKIPPGIADGANLRLAGKGRQMMRRKGDLYLEIHIAPHPLFRREGDDIIAHAPINISTALLGGAAEVNTIEGTRSVKIPPGIQPGQKIRIKGHGVKRLKGSGSGDLYIEIGILVPKELTPAQLKLAEQLKATGL